MIQRAFFASCLIVTLASLSLMGFVWHQSSLAANAAASATLRLADAQAANQAKIVEAFTRTQATNEEILKHLRLMAKPAQASQTPEWVPVSFKLTQERPDGPPAVGYEATLISGSAILVAQGIQRESDATGLIDFGVVHPGNWEFELSKTSDERRTWKCRGYLNVLPGAGIQKTIVCPGQPAIQFGVNLRVQWPADLAHKDLRLQATFVQAPTTFQPSLKWTAIDASGNRGSRTILCGPGDKQIEIGGATSLTLWHFYVESHKSRRVQRVFGDLCFQRGQSQSDAVAMETGSFLPQCLVVLRPYARQQKARNGERFEVLAHTAATDEAASGSKLIAVIPMTARKRWVLIGLSKNSGVV